MPKKREVADPEPAPEPVLPPPPAYPDAPRVRREGEEGEGPMVAFDPGTGLLYRLDTEGRVVHIATPAGFEPTHEGGLRPAR